MRVLLFALLLVFVACQSEASDTAVPASGVDSADPVAEADVSTAGEFVEPSDRLNLNTATEDDFKALGIGDKMAHEFDEYRPYTSIREFRQEIGKYINDDADQLAEYEQMVFVPVNVEASDAETIAQLPGVSAEEAEQLAAGMPYASADEFLTAYEAISGEPDAEGARMYLAAE